VDLEVGHSPIRALLASCHGGGRDREGDVNMIKRSVLSIVYAALIAALLFRIWQHSTDAFMLAGIAVIAAVALGASATLLVVALDRRAAPTASEAEREGSAVER
jgi:hypothetical protein